MRGSTGAHHLRSRLCFSSSVRHVWFRQIRCKNKKNINKWMRKNYCKILVYVQWCVATSWGGVFLFHNFNPEDDLKYFLPEIFVISYLRWFHSYSSQRVVGPKLIFCNHFFSSICMYLSFNFLLFATPPTHTYVSLSSSSSCHAARTDLCNPLSPPVSIVDCS